MISLTEGICCFIVLVRRHSKIDKSYGRDIILSDLTGFQIEAYLHLRTCNCSSHLAHLALLSPLKLR